MTRVALIAFLGLILAGSASAIGVVSGEIVCISGRPWLSFRTPVTGDIDGQPGAVWIGALKRENTNHGYVRHDDQWMVPPGGQLPTWRVFEGGLVAQEVHVPFVGVESLAPGAPNPTLEQLDSYQYAVGIGVLPAAAANTIQQQQAAHQALTEALALPQTPMPSEQDVGPNAWETHEQALEEGASRRRQALTQLGAGYATNPQFAQAYAQASAAANTAVEHPENLQPPAEISADSINRAYVEQNMVDAQRASTVTIGGITDANRRCVREEE